MNKDDLPDINLPVCEKESLKNVDEIAEQCQSKELLTLDGFDGVNQHVTSNQIACQELLVDVNKKRENYLPWNDYFMAVAFLSAMRSKDPVTQVINFNKIVCNSAINHLGQTN